MTYILSSYSFYTHENKILAKNRAQNVEKWPSYLNLKSCSLVDFDIWSLRKHCFKCVLYPNMSLQSVFEVLLHIIRGYTLITLVDSGGGGFKQKLIFTIKGGGLVGKKLMVC